MGRAEILEKLERCRIEGDELPDKLPAFPQCDDPVQRFLEEAEGVGTIVIEESGLPESLTTLLRETRAERIYWQGLTGAQGLGIEFLGADGIGGGPPVLLFSEHPDRVFTPPVSIVQEAHSRENLADVELSLGLAESGIAETGTIVESTFEGWGRILPILAPNHAVILSKSRIRVGLADYFSNLRLAEGESARILITGPSRTADIEKTLVLGVHGPKNLFVILVP